MKRRFPNLPLLVSLAAYLAAGAQPVSAASETIDQLCAKKDAPFKELKPPRPTDASMKDAGVQNDLPISADQEKQLKFGKPLCDGIEAGAQLKDSCDLTFAEIYRDVHNSNLTLETALDSVCGKLKEIASCTGQAGTEKCAAGIYGVSADIKTATDEINKFVEVLRQRQTLHVKAAAQDQAAKAAKTAPAIKAKSDMFSYANAGSPATEIPKTQLGQCASQITGGAPAANAPGTPFCEHTNAAAEATFYASQLELQIKPLATVATGLAKTGATTTGNGNDLTTNGPDPKNKSGLLGGMGLSDLIGLATVGVAGAGLYCAATQSCSQSQPTSSSSITNQGTTTSPTGSSAANAQGPQTDSLGSTTASSAAATPPATTNASSTPPAGTGGGGGGGSASESPLAPFSGKLASAAAPAPTSGSGSSSSGGASLGSSDGAGAKGTATDTSRAPASASGDLGAGFSGGGGGAMGGSAGAGFNLGDAKSATPTDNALKNILNGDSPPADLGGGFTGGTSPAGSVASADAALTDPDNLFRRVRETHVRCLKRGCVGMEVGTNI